ncbi:MAG: hypothetical protein RLZZ230_876 [Candidatus Parcubacteria bacterium]|jgi:mRNA-degrading endonuclease YafQ of YafQ-DinJ toxin-antitoxin module
MIIISITPQFRRMFKKLEQSLQEEALEKIELFSDPTNHQSLKAHKLNGAHKHRHSFSVNYKTRIVFTFTSPTEAILTAIGSHKIYN